MLQRSMNVEAVIRTVVRELVVKRDFRLPLHIATLAANGASLVTRIEAPPADAEPLSVTQTHVAGDVGDEGFASPLHLLITDATGRVRVAIARGRGAPTFLVPVPESGGA